MTGERAGTWVERARARRALGHHVIWVVTLLALVLTVWVVPDPGDLGVFWGVFGVSAAWGAAATTWSLLLREQSRSAIADGTGERAVPRSGGRRGAGRPHPRSRRARGRVEEQRRRLGSPWRLRHLPFYVAALAVGLGPALAVRLPADDAWTLALITPLAMTIGWLSGVCVPLFALVLALCGVGVVGFGGPLLTGRADGRPVRRLPFLGPFLATVSLLALPLTIVGVVSYDSPYRRDWLPLVGIVRDGVEVTRPALLLIGQVATWTMVVGIGVGFMIHRVALARGVADEPGTEPDPGPRTLVRGVRQALGGAWHGGDMAIRSGTKVKWKWGSSWAEGTVSEVHHDDVSRTTKGEKVTRHGSDDDPAYVIEQEDGTTVLKRQSEVERA